MYTAELPNPTVRRWELGRRLHEAREAAGKSVEAAAEYLGCHPSKISRLENASRGPNARDIRKLCSFYSVSDVERDELIELARKAQQPGWWQNYNEVASRSGTYLGLEVAATRLREYETIRVPGLLQTSEYTRAIMRRIIPNLDIEAVEQYVESRRTRQEIFLADNSKRYWGIVDEAVLRRRVGGPEVMREQIFHILNIISQPNITFQILPFEAGAHPGMEGTFVILSFPQDFMADVVYVEGRSGQLFLDRKTEINLYIDDFDHLRALAEPPDTTATRMEQIIKDIT